VVEDSSRITPILFVCRVAPSFVSSTHALQVIAHCEGSEPTGEPHMRTARCCTGSMQTWPPRRTISAGHKRWRRMRLSSCAFSASCGRTPREVLRQPRPLHGRARKNDRSGRRGVTFDPPRAHVSSPLRSPKKKRREAGEVASRRAGANTGKLFATVWDRARDVPSSEMYLNHTVSADPGEPYG
jgi:hypothetical protein